MKPVIFKPSVYDTSFAKECLAFDRTWYGIYVRGFVPEKGKELAGCGSVWRVA